MKLLRRVVAWWRAHRDRQMVELIANGRRTFGARWCPVCSFRRYGVMHGFHVDAAAPHDCPEVSPQDAQPEARR